MKENVIRIKSFAIALRIIKAYQVLVEQKEYILSKQLLRSGTSIRANVEEIIKILSSIVKTNKQIINS